MEMKTNLYLRDKRCYIGLISLLITIFFEMLDYMFHGGLYCVNSDITWDQIYVKHQKKLVHTLYVIINLCL